MNSSGMLRHVVIVVFLISKHSGADFPDNKAENLLLDGQTTEFSSTPLATSISTDPGVTESTTQSTTNQQTGISTDSPSLSSEEPSITTQESSITTQKPSVTTWETDKTTDNQQPSSVTPGEVINCPAPDPCECEAYFGDTPDAIDCRNSDTDTFPEFTFNQADDPSQWLYLSIYSYTNINEIPENAVASLPNLEELIISGFLNLTTVHQKAFAGLPNLERLSLQFNSGLQILPDNLFADLAKLKSLHLQNNALSSIRSEVFAGIANLEFINMRGNSLKTIPSDAFKSFQQLKTLILERNGMLAIDGNTFGFLSNLEWLNLKDNELKTLPEDVFNNLFKLTDLELDSNWLTTFPLSSLTNVTQGRTMRRLSLERNYGLPCLLERKIKAAIDVTTLNFPILCEPSPMICPTELCTCNSLGEIYCAYKDLTEVPEFAVSEDPSHFSSLQLQNNKLTNIPGNAFVNLPELKHIFIFNNPIRSIHLNSFRGLPLLNTLSLSFNEIAELPDNVFVELVELQTLYVNGNRIPTITSRTFAGLGNVESLLISANTIETLSDNCFASMTKLRSLYVGKNKLTTIAANAFSGLSNLQSLSLSENSDLETLPTEVFTSLTSLEKLDIDKCNLNNFPVSSLAEATAGRQMESLSLKNNPIPCSVLAEINTTINIKDFEIPAECSDIEGTTPDTESSSPSPSDSPTPTSAPPSPQQTTPNSSGHRVLLTTKLYIYILLFYCLQGRCFQ